MWNIYKHAMLCVSGKFQEHFPTLHSLSDDPVSPGLPKTYWQETEILFLNLKKQEFIQIKSKMALMDAYDN